MSQNSNNRGAKTHRDAGEGSISSNEVGSRTPDQRPTQVRGCNHKTAQHIDALFLLFDHSRTADVRMQDEKKSIGVV
jgi:hypothetical protein